MSTATTIARVGAPANPISTPAVTTTTASASCPYDDRLEHGFTVRAGEMAYIPRAWQHLPINASEREAVTFIVVMSDP